MRPSLHDSSRLQLSIRYQFWMEATEALRDVAIPADGLMGGKDFRKLLRADAFPFRRFEVGT